MFLFSDPALALLTLLVIISSVYYHRRYGNFVVLAWCIPLLGQLAYYTLLTFGVEPFVSQLPWRLALIRPSQFGFFSLLILALLNSQLLRAIESSLQRIKEWKHGSRTL